MLAAMAVEKQRLRRSLSEMGKIAVEKTGKSDARDQIPMPRA